MTVHLSKIKCSRVLRLSVIVQFSYKIRIWVCSPLYCKGEKDRKTKQNKKKGKRLWLSYEINNKHWFNLRNWDWLKQVTLYLILTELCVWPLKLCVFSFGSIHLRFFILLPSKFFFIIYLIMIRFTSRRKKCNQVIHIWDCIIS